MPKHPELEKFRSPGARAATNLGAALDNRGFARLVQTNFRVGPSGDQYEQEADCIAGDLNFETSVRDKVDWEVLVSVAVIMLPTTPCCR